jgi:predicted CXXCH cytochrome family protein
MPNTNPAYIGTSLADDHPVNFTYNNALYLADDGLNDPATGDIPGLLISGKVQCSSCHDVHNNGNGKFLVMNNDSSALCTTCHHK